MGRCLEVHHALRLGGFGVKDCQSVLLQHARLTCSCLAKDPDQRCIVIGDISGARDVPSTLRDPFYSYEICRSAINHMVTHL